MRAIIDRMLRSLKGLYHFFIALFAVLWFRFPGRRLTVIGVTGTDGKTTTATLIYTILKAAGIRASMITSVHAVVGGRVYDTGFHVTTPDSFAVQRYLRKAVDHGDTHVVLEVTSHGLSQHRVFGIPFAVGVLTNVTHEHLDWHKTMEHYRAAKLSLLRRAAIAVINRDDAETYTRAAPFLRNKRFFSYGIRREAKINPETVPFTTELPGEFNRYNCLAALAAAGALGIDMGIARKAIASFEGVKGRLEVVQKKPFWVIVDFAHTPNALLQVLRTVRTLTKKRLIHVFGSAGLRDRSKRPLMGQASARFSDIIVLTEEDYRTENVETIMNEIAGGIPEGKTVYRLGQRRDAVVFAIGSARPGDLVLITGKGHEQSLCRGRREIPWSDVEEAGKALRKKR
ncbi:UDP-N-acetylmuramoyl-L-alanyl-D-glutamate--2,6-diaminopimelate ligase [Patescibacteria group bacterium]|nr:UDP-N-acetylmuramoyl-L-alanyl-D-glutamate--2,6-diaminopimelate ligase [Patescibacteria group bacterium]